MKRWGWVDRQTYPTRANCSPIFESFCWSCICVGCWPNNFQYRHETLLKIVGYTGRKNYFRDKTLGDEANFVTQETFARPKMYFLVQIVFVVQDLEKFVVKWEFGANNCAANETIVRQNASSQKVHNKCLADFVMQSPRKLGGTIGAEIYLATKKWLVETKNFVAQGFTGFQIKTPDIHHSLFISSLPHLLPQIPKFLSPPNSKSLLLQIPNLLSFFPLSPSTIKGIRGKSLFLLIKNIFFW